MWYCYIAYQNTFKKFQQYFPETGQGVDTVQSTLSWLTHISSNQWWYIVVIISNVVPYWNAGSIKNNEY